MAGARGRVKLALQGDEELGAAVRKRRGHHADDFIGFAVKREPAAENRRVGIELTRPEIVGEHDDQRAAELILLLGVPPAQLWRHAENVDERRRRADTWYARRFAGSCQRERDVHRPADRRKHGVARLPLGVLGEGCRAGTARRLGVKDHDEVLPLGKRQGLQQHAVEDAEDRARHADAKRERQHCQGRHEARTDERARGESHFLPQTMHAIPSSEL